MLLRYACAQNPHIRLVCCGFSHFASLEIPLAIQFRWWGNRLSRMLLRYACAQNPHIRLVCCGFSHFASLEIPLAIQFRWWGKPSVKYASALCSLCKCSHTPNNKSVLLYVATHPLSNLRSYITRLWRVAMPGYRHALPTPCRADTYHTCHPRQPPMRISYRERSPPPRSARR